MAAGKTAAVTVIAVGHLLGGRCRCRYWVWLPLGRRWKCIELGPLKPSYEWRVRVEREASSQMVLGEAVVTLRVMFRSPRQRLAVQLGIGH